MWGLLLTASLLLLILELAADKMYPKTQAADNVYPKPQINIGMHLPGKATEYIDWLSK